jgi:hypothetical protein
VESPEHGGPSTSVVARYLHALAHMDWDQVEMCLAAGVLRRGPYGDDYEGAASYLSFLRRTMPTLPGYRMDVDRITELGHQRAMAELRETIEAEGGLLVTHECLVFDTDADGLLKEICIYIRQTQKA